MKAQNAIQFDPDKRILTCRGDWNLANLAQLKSLLAAISWPARGQVSIDGTSIARMDSAGAWLLIDLKNTLSRQGLRIEWVHFPEQSRSLLAIIENQVREQTPLPASKKITFLTAVGKNTIEQLQEFQLYLAFIGGLTFETLRLILHPRHWRWNALASVIYRTGYQGLPIIALLSFLIGVVLTYQMGLQLRNYGANIYIVDLLGLSVLREFGPLITAIMVSGRTGSAFTASIGMMKLNQEIDALNTLGVTPAELLLLPRILGLLISLPLLTMWSDIFGVVGGMVMSNNMLGITWYEFLQRFPQQIPLRAFLIGIGKAPVFALIIASIGCFQGMQVKNSADSVGQNTTRSVVLAIFFIIVADAVFSVIFSKMKL
ncbi:putative phospholipid ABC transporter permease protein MlaE [Aquicella siphonis]|uniref:Putative phospholipid ABC transporter permease protein MlaE n=1 Tax=Aquicella siphonis TaxID=254247 RepID=A0A5E4PFS7_9COXI|nr:MlaE family lipid ABC transporter permease subunit [Aquicella siphonis]VVC75850.1 putative phospholipid ABC transporter permease protein MlaE [Aquicella siphonis]